MSPGVRYVLDLADPRGRFDRVDLIWAAVTLIAGQLAFVLGLWIMNASVLGWRGFLANLVFGWLGYAAISKRLQGTGAQSPSTAARRAVHERSTRPRIQPSCCVGVVWRAQRSTGTPIPSSQAPSATGDS